ncbi:hypothetical protein BKP56_09330 [Marinilactibacillus sp. 15R]|uniref:hypothetical protein n=1 Tax=Marinilactibacillus sp. 15R TaxID=1911586 RepID=UPI00090BAD0D|nr:hypothetical protein [Marinilactibacillus sp. 15R]API89443.1 hypothetical protein BKP56_09330 [Marinilactibacillus sp. 15R]
MNIELTGIQYKIDSGVTTSIDVQFSGRGENNQDYLSARVSVVDGDLDNMTRSEITQAARDKMAGWFTETSE